MTGHGSHQVDQYTRSSTFFVIEAGLSSGSRLIIPGAQLGSQCPRANRPHAYAESCL